MVDIPAEDIPVQTENLVRSDVRLMMREIDEILTRMCDKILAFAVMRGRPGADLRTAVGRLITNIEESVFDNSLPDKMYAVFNAAYVAGITVAGLEPVLAQLRVEAPTTNGSTWTTQAAIYLTLATESRVISDIDFASRDDIVPVQYQMKINFDQAKEWSADEEDNIVYAKLVDLAAKLTRYLAAEALPLPTIVYYDMRPQPALSMSYRVYADASRTEELMADNKVVHPAFMRGVFRALSA